jgi:ferredoxin
VAAVLSPPRHLAAACAAERAGIAGCKACSDVRPHDALRFTIAGPQIDSDACQRCGACTAACPVGALERAYLPDDELLGTVESAVRAQPELLVLTCGHESLAAENGAADGIVRLAIPCIQLVSDDLLIFAVLQGARSVRVEPSSSCPHGPHRQPLRAVRAAQETLRARGWDHSRIEMTDVQGATRGGSSSDSKPPVMVKPLSVLELGGRRFERRMSLLKALGTSEASLSAETVSQAAPWRRATVNESTCTTCGSCAFVCPTGALGLGENGTALYGREAACIGCELCEHACPEAAVTLSPVVPANVESRLLVRSNVAGCAHCGRPLLPEPLVRRLEDKLARSDAAGRAALRLCERCKGSQLFDPGAVREPLPPAEAPQTAPVRPDEQGPSQNEGGLSRRD